MRSFVGKQKQKIGNRDDNNKIIRHQSHVWSQGLYCDCAGVEPNLKGVKSCVVSICSFFWFSYFEGWSGGKFFYVLASFFRCFKRFHCALPLIVVHSDIWNFSCFAFFTFCPAGQAFIFVLTQKRNKKVRTEKAFTGILHAAPSHAAQTPRRASSSNSTAFLFHPKVTTFRILSKTFSGHILTRFYFTIENEFH